MNRRRPGKKGITSRSSVKKWKNRRKLLEKTRQVSFRIITVTAACTAIFAAGYSGWQWMRASDMFRISSVEISGCKRIHREDILGIAGISPGLNLTDIDVDVLKRRLESSPWIKHADIERRFPDNLTIRITERRPVAFASSGGFYLVDADGVIFKKYDIVKEKFSLPIISGFRIIKGNDGRWQPDSDTSRAGIRAALKIISLASRGIRVLGISNISQIDVTGGHPVVYTVDGGVPFRFGPNNLKKQFIRAEKILYHLYTSGEFGKVRMVNVDFMDRMALAQFKGT